MFLNDALAKLRQTKRRPAKKRKPSVPTVGNQAIYAALMAALKNKIGPLSVTDLARAMNCSIGEASKRVKAAGPLVSVTKDGRRKMVGLNMALSWAEWQRLR